jgi:hypothetical protein
MSTLKNGNIQKIMEIKWKVIPTLSKKKIAKKHRKKSKKVKSYFEESRTEFTILSASLFCSLGT